MQGNPRVGFSCHYVSIVDGYLEFMVMLVINDLERSLRFRQSKAVRVLTDMYYVVLRASEMHGIVSSPRYLRLYACME